MAAASPTGNHPKLTERAQVWQSSLCACCGSPECCFGCLCTPCLWGVNNREFFTDKKATGPCCKYFWCCPCACVFTGTMRSEIRAKYNLAESPCNDCMVHCCCGPCAVCQEAREIKYFKTVDPNAQYTAPGSQKIEVGGEHAAPGESINDRVKVTETKVTERMRDMDRSHPSNLAANPNVEGGAGGAPAQHQQGVDGVQALPPSHGQGGVPQSHMQQV